MTAEEFNVVPGSLLIAPDRTLRCVDRMTGNIHPFIGAFVFLGPSLLRVEDFGTESIVVFSCCSGRVMHVNIEWIRRTHRIIP